MTQTSISATDDVSETTPGGFTPEGPGGKNDARQREAPIDMAPIAFPGSDAGKIAVPRPALTAGRQTPPGSTPSSLIWRNVTRSAWRVSRAASKMDNPRSATGSRWGLTPRQSMGAECARRGKSAVITGCVHLLAGDYTDIGLIVGWSRR
jgi:hypothetical protein